MSDIHALIGQAQTPPPEAINFKTQPIDRPEVTQNLMDTFEFINAKDLVTNYKPVPSIIKRFIGKDNVSFLVAAPGSLKTFIVLDIAFCITNGIEWAGRRTLSPYPVIYLAGEGHGGIVPRLKALEIKYGRPTSNKLFVSELPADLLSIDSTAAVVNGIFRSCREVGELPVLVIIDTFHRNTSGDENLSKDFGQLLKNLDIEFRRCLPGISFLFVHHTGHGDDKRGRGTSAIKASCDTEWIASRKGDQVTLTCAKFKDGAEPPGMIFKTVEVETGWFDEDGDPITSLYLDYIGEEDDQSVQKTKKLSVRDEAILTSLSRAIGEHGISPSLDITARFSGFDGNIGKTRKVVHFDFWKEQVYPVIDADNDNAKRMAFKRARDKFRDLGIIQTMNDYWWRIDF